MKYQIKAMTQEDRKDVIDIFNHYIENSFAAYPEKKVPYEFFDMFLKLTEGYAAVTARDEQGVVIGFGILRAHNPIPTFFKTAEMAYFIKPDYTGRGIGKMILGNLVDRAREKGLTSLLASITSLNEGSLNFHRKNGFTECGRFLKIGNKNGKTFDVVWMQKML